MASRSRTRTSFGFSLGTLGSLPLPLSRSFGSGLGSGGYSGYSSSYSPAAYSGYSSSGYLGRLSHHTSGLPLSTHSQYRSSYEPDNLFSRDYSRRNSAASSQYSRTRPDSDYSWRSRSSEAGREVRSASRELGQYRESPTETWRERWSATPVRQSARPRPNLTRPDPATEMKYSTPRRSYSLHDLSREGGAGGRDWREGSQSRGGLALATHGVTEAGLVRARSMVDLSTASPAQGRAAAGAWRGSYSNLASSSTSLAASLSRNSTDLGYLSLPGSRRQSLGVSSHTVTLSHCHTTSHYHTVTLSGSRQVTPVIGRYAGDIRAKI